MRSFAGIFISLLFILTIASCKKTDEAIPPEIEVFSPGENMLITLPATIIVKFRVTSEPTITYLRIGLEDADQVPFAKPVFLNPAAGESDFEVELPVEILPDETGGTFFLHVKAENSEGEANKFVRLFLKNPELVSKGFYLISGEGIQQTKVTFYDTLFSATDFVVLPHAFTDVAVSFPEEMLIVSTQSPGKIQAFRHQNNELIWEEEAPMPIPEFYDMKLADGIVYTGTGNGRVWGFRANNGNKQFISDLVFDSVPGKIGVFEDYVLADYQSVTGPERGWLIFYKETAAPFQKHVSQLKVQEFYPTLSKNQAVVFGNIGSIGVIQFYDIEDNDILISLNFATGIITASCPVEPGYFLIAVGNDIWQFNEQQQSLTLFRQTAEDVVDLQYDFTSQQVYVAEEQRVLVYNTTGDTLVAELGIGEPVRAIRLRIGYPE